jgi:hypothetical protein
MKRFRFTLLAICLVLLWLGWTDASLYLRNPEPATISLAELQRAGAPREWLHVTGGYQDLQNAISTSGTVKLEAFLVPLKTSPDADSFRVLVETRDPQILDLLRTYYFKLDTPAEQQRFLAEHAGEFHARRDVTGTLITGLIASGNRDKLMTLAKQLGMQVPEDVIFISEGKQPPKWRGFLFLALALAGLVKFGMMMRKKGPAAPAA